MHPEIELALKNMRKALAEGWDKLNELLDQYVETKNVSMTERMVIEDTIRDLISNDEFMKRVARIRECQEFIRGLER